MRIGKTHIVFRAFYFNYHTREVGQMEPEITKTKIIPVGWQVLVSIEKVAEKTRSGLYVPQNARERQQMQMTEGKIVAIGDEAWGKYEEKSFRPEAGDWVIFAKYGGYEIKLYEGTPDEQEFRLLNDQDIFAVKREV